MPLDEVSELYADMLEYRQQMYEKVPYSHIQYHRTFELLRKLPYSNCGWDCCDV